MRKLLCVWLLIGTSELTHAHETLAGQDLVAQVVHQVLALHHSPVTMLLVLVAIVLSGSLRKRFSGPN